ncbi:MAG: TonB-dependent receptor [Lysobacter sp.]
MIKPLAAAISSILLFATMSASAQAQDTTPDDAAQDANKPAESKTDDRKKNTRAVDMDHVVVTGSRTGKAVDKIPGAVTVISKAEVQHTLLLTDDATAVLARTVPGYSESSQQLSNSGETLRGRTALRLFDGIPQGSPLREGNRAGTFTDMGVIGRIEVINGPSASEGIGAAGGIINYISKVPDEGTHTTVTSRYSSQFHDDSSGWKFGLTFGHKEDAYDLLVSAATIERGVDYDGNGRRVGRRGSGALSDSETENLFIKLGANFGANDEQRLQGSISRFNVIGKGNYIGVTGNRALGITSTSERGQPLGAKTEFNDFEQYSLSYTHSNLFGGIFTTDFYRASQAMRYVAENGSDKQDPLIAPLGQLVDQSEINSQKRGVRTSWTRPELFAVEGLELRAGVDVVQDEAQQSLALTRRLWVPPMLYKSTAPYAQVSYDAGPLTLSGGFRREDGELSVDDYTTTWFRKRVFVEGGTLSYTANLPNIGAIVRLPNNWSVFASYGKGFSLPNVGIPLRNINIPGQSVSGILDLQAILVDNKEVGFNWVGDRFNLGGSVYESSSDLGVSLSVDPVTNDYIMNRAPVKIRGFELSGGGAITDTLRATALYSHIRGKTTSAKGGVGPLDKDMGVSDINPDKLAGTLTWNFMPKGDLTLGATTLLSRSINTGEKTKGYTLFDLGVNYDIRYGKLSLGIENLTDKFYLLSYSQIGSNDNYMSGRGRVFSLTHTITF